MFQQFTNYSFFMQTVVILASAKMGTMLVPARLFTFFIVGEAVEIKLTVLSYESTL